MIKFIKLSFVLFLFSTFMTSCVKDEIDEELKNAEFGVLQEGAITLMNKNVDNNTINLYLFSDSIDVNSRGASGKGQMIIFTMHSSKINELDSGVYTYDSTGTVGLKTFTYSDFFENLNQLTSIDNNGKPIPDDIIKSGTVSVGNNNGEYSITFDCIGSKGQAVTGSFIGSLAYYQRGAEEHGSVTVGNNSFFLTSGIQQFVKTDSTSEEGFTLNLQLFSSGMILPITNELGKGQYIWFQMHSSNRDSLDLGTYLYQPAKYPLIKTFTSARLNEAFYSEEGEKFTVIKDGRINIDKKGEIYTVTFGCTTEDGKKVKGEFKGPLDYKVQYYKGSL